MSTKDGEGESSSVSTFGDARWHTRWIVTGLLVLLTWRCIALVNREWLSQFPSWLLLILTGLAPQLFFLIFPIATRKPAWCSTLALPKRSNLLVEAAIAIPTTIATIVGLAAIDYFLGRVSPGSSLTPESVANMAKSSNSVVVYLILIFSFTFAPIAEEVFFRGFLHNAFRARMPLIVAGIVQSFIFGFSHFYGATHATVAFVLGLLLTAVYEWRKTIVAPIMLHAGINFVMAIGTAFMMFGYANRAVLGVIGDPSDTECVIRRIAPNSAANEAGLHVGDTIIAFNNEPVRDFPHLVELVPLYRPGDEIPIKVNRSGTILEIFVVLHRRGDP